MRMRKKKNGQARLDACRDRLLTVSELPMTSPVTALGEGYDRVYLEIGAGKGGFACEMARREPTAAYFAMERVTDCVVLCAERAESGEYGELKNLRFIIDTADNLLNIFSPLTVDTVFLNFSDPWSKKGYAKRRLTHRRYLALYLNLLRDGGKIRFKKARIDGNTSCIRAGIAVIQEHIHMPSRKCTGETGTDAVFKKKQMAGLYMVFHAKPRHLGLAPIQCRRFVLATVLDALSCLRLSQPLATLRRDAFSERRGSSSAWQQPCRTGWRNRLRRRTC